ncbi:flavin-containing monooxygenase [Spathaspora passalidarum NRRL Y-27907]|uniref:Flavin-containing monooxygenase n=1 Tax=Spathaspora passalidarum (strain NRRL Y-27907 / 11-Y1) TaxID=619300 RepID=G3AEF1_SPAPN|nr:flavin-containing monooxygenase [Spathaspora passalidarum NRRL Y-27907]EGW35739.1 flavin-containing monooxygenase [Spathaspora passalidarum NRRL Y-27907]
MTVYKDIHAAISHINSVAVIGAGPGGASTIKALLAERKFSHVQGFEKRSDFGGIWNHTDITDSHEVPIPCEKPIELNPVVVDGKYVYPSPVYDSLDTNVPKDLMSYSGLEFDSHLPIFPDRRDVLKYVCKYSEKVRPYVRFDTKVVSVELLDDICKWQVVSRPVSTETKGGTIGVDDVVELYDAVVIATGNYDLPYIPDRPGMTAWNEQFPGTITHAKWYRNPRQFKDVTGKIIIVGNSASAGDLAYQIATTLKQKVYKSKRSGSLVPAGKSDLIEEVADIEKFDIDTKSVVLVDGTVLADVGAVVFATGYIKSFPFFKANPTHPLVTDGHKVHGTFNHVILYNYPNLAIIGLPRFVLPTRTSETQSCWLASIWAQKIALPSVQHMQQWEQDRVDLKGNGSKFHDMINLEDVRYCISLTEQVIKAGGNLIPHAWDKQSISVRGMIKSIKEAYIEYKGKTGKCAASYSELIDAGLLDSVTLPDEKLQELGFKV